MPPDFSTFPRVDALLDDDAVQPAIRELGRERVRELVREVLARFREQLLAGSRDRAPTLPEVISEIHAGAATLLRRRVEPVVNATGVILHTNLGRAPLSALAVARLAEGAAGYSSIELDLETGKRGRRGAFVEDALCQLLGCEAALVVNNCAAAALLMLSALAKGKRVVVSRGELVEIGGGFRVPEVLEESGATLLEVGTTNKTRLADYERALDAHPDAVVMVVHAGNFQQTGFVEKPALPELAALCRARSVPLLQDLGGGALVELAEVGLVGEPLARDALRDGVDVTTFSTDKVLGGPQGGVAAGRRALIERMRRHPLHRALRLGRLPTIALEATLEAYLRGDAWREIPALAAASADVGRLRARVEGWIEHLGAVEGWDLRVAAVTAEMGGGSLAGRTVPSVALAIRSERVGPDELLRALRLGRPPIVGRAEEGASLLDARTVAERYDAELPRRVREALEGLSRERPGEFPNGRERR
jgi:L-seryl-tRNA(Ser) seleniumtransferase